MPSGRSSRLRTYVKIGVLKNFAIFTGKQLESPFNKVASLKAFNFIKKRLQHMCFPVHIANFLRTLFYKHLWWLFLTRRFFFSELKYTTFDLLNTNIFVVCLKYWGKYKLFEKFFEEHFSSNN